jgi:hypothetical protein
MSLDDGVTAQEWASIPEQVLREMEIEGIPNHQDFSLLRNMKMVDENGETFGMKMKRIVMRV